MSGLEHLKEYLVCKNAEIEFMKWDGWKEIKVDDKWSIIYLPAGEGNNVFLVLCEHRNVNCRRCAKSVPEEVWKKKKTLQKMQSY